MKKEDRGEADQLLTLFTEDFGRLEVLARAIRKIASKLRASADLFYFSEIEFIQGKNYKTLTDAVVIDKFKHLRQSPEKLEIVYKIAEIIDLLVVKEEKDTQIWQLLFQAITRAALVKTVQGQPLPTLSISPIFFWKLAVILGYSPELYNCACCHKKLLPEMLFFSPQDGGVVCWQCKSKENECKEILVDTIKIIRLFLKEPFEMVQGLVITKDVQENLEQITDFYFQGLTSVLGKI